MCEHAHRVHGRGLGQLAGLLPALAGQLDLLLVVVVLVVVVLDELVGDLGAPTCSTPTASFSSSVGSAPMISGVRASSMRMLSASSTRAK